jgi:MFS family permease
MGPLVDRLSRKRLMIVSDLVRAATFVMLPFVDDPRAIVAVAAVNGVATGFFRPAVWAGLPNLVDDDEREQATSLLTTVENVAWTIGPAMAGLLLASNGVDLAGQAVMPSPVALALADPMAAPARRPDQ